MNPLMIEDGGVWKIRIPPRKEEVHERICNSITRAYGVQFRA